MSLARASSPREEGSWGDGRNKVQRTCTRITVAWPSSACASRCCGPLYASTTRIETRLNASWVPLRTSRFTFPLATAHMPALLCGPMALAHGSHFARHHFGIFIAIDCAFCICVCFFLRLCLHLSVCVNNCTAPYTFPFLNHHGLALSLCLRHLVTVTPHDCSYPILEKSFQDASTGQAQPSCACYHPVHQQLHSSLQRSPW